MSIENKLIIPGVTMSRLPNVGNSKGPVYQWKDFTDGRVRQISWFSRPKGTLFGDHFHTGKDPSKRPELFGVVHGSFEFHAYDKFTGERGSAVLQEGDVISINPHILHRFQALTDVVYIEPRISIYGEIPDQYSAEDYAHYTRY